MGLQEDVFWGLCSREYEALTKQFQQARDLQLGMLAAVRADLHNTAGKSFSKIFDGKDFMPGASDNSLEARIHSLIAQGYAPAAAAAIASSTQTKEQRIHLIQSTMQAAEARKTKPRRKAG